MVFIVHIYSITEYVRILCYWLSYTAEVLLSEFRSIRGRMTPDSRGHCKSRAIGISLMEEFTTALAYCMKISRVVPCNLGI